jgi:hypothetical protein
MQAEFREMFRRDVNNPQLGDIIIHSLEGFASDLEGRAAVSDIYVDLFDRAGMSVAASVTVAGVGMLVVSGAVTGAVVLLVSGLAGLGLAGAGRSLMKFSGRKSTADADKVRRLARGLEVKT